MNEYKKKTRESFINYFQNDEKHQELSVDDRIEIFRTILLGSSDITKDLLNDILSDYNVSNHEIIEVNYENK